MLEWFLYFKIASKVAPLVLLTKGLSFEYLEILRFCTILEKSYLKPMQFLDQFLQVHYFQLNEFHLCQQTYQIEEVLLFSRIAYCQQQTFHLDFHNISFLFFLKERHKNFFVLYNGILFSSLLFCRKMFCNLVRCHYCFRQSFIKEEHLIT